mgnify:CR=1 FL=1
MKRLFIILTLIILSSYTYKVVIGEYNKGGLKAKEKEEVVFCSKKKKKKFIKKRRV